MSQKLEIAQLGNPILRRCAQPVKQVNNPQIQTLIDDLILTVDQTHGVGIAAPQVSVSDRLFIVASRPNLRYPHAPTMEPTAMINPLIVNCSGEPVKGWEGCLSVPGMRGLVPRYPVITVEYTSRDGKLHQVELTDFVARIFQHELDHLDGKVFLDRVEKTEDLMSESEYQKQMITNL
ncbi:MAG: peptide deformylase [Microcoleaceae cyanobacterium]